MPAALLTTACTLMCPHGGTVTIACSNTSTQAGGAYVLRPSDSYTIAGCPFAIGSSPHPCVSVEWIVSDQHTKVAGDATLSSQSVGLCKASDLAPQGTVLITPAQTRAMGS